MTSNPGKTPLKSAPLCVDVCVPVPLRNLFTYRLPDDLAPDTVLPGHRVLVPFRSKMMHGVTFGRPYCPENPPARLRSLVSYDDGARILAPEIAELLDWMVAYYKAPPGELLRLVLPPGLLRETDCRYNLTPEGRTALPDMAPHEAAVLQLLSGKALTKAQWEVAAKTALPFKALLAWENNGWLALEGQKDSGEVVPHVTVVAVSDIPVKAVTAQLTRAPKQLEVWLWLANHSPFVVQSLVSRHFKGASSVLATLEEKQLIERRRVPTHEVRERLLPPEPEPPRILKAGQQAAVESLCEALDQRAFAPFLLFGVTGSGKTEVYLRAIQACLAQGRKALFLVPEISLTPLMRRRLTERLGDRLAILHSMVGSARRSESWSRVLAGGADVVLGARSAVFAPLPDLGLVVVDEEHDGSYKQNDGVRYHARDVALVRAKMAGATVVMGSATPSMESWHNVESGRFKLLRMPERAGEALLPKVRIVDMREAFKAARSRVIFSQEMLGCMEETLAAGHQAMILLNRRGYHNFLMCRRCGESVMCTQCAVSLTYHKREDFLKCHYCGTTAQVPEGCGHCEAPASAMQFFGEGTQHIAQSLAEAFPAASIDRLDRDRLTRRDAQEAILSRFEHGETDILVGTQMIAKGHDFPNVTLVGIVNADLGLRIPDFRAAETVFQLITQVAGRSGRGGLPGQVVIQTYMPDHYSIQAASEHDFEAFLAREKRFRERLFYPPYAYMVCITLQHRLDETALEAAMVMTRLLRRAESHGPLVVLGPAKAPVAKIKNLHRVQIVLKASNRKWLHTLADHAVEAVVKQKLMPREAVFLDIDPHQFL